MTSLTIVGNVCAEPEVRQTNSGMQIVELRIASNEGKDKTVFWTTKFLGNKAGEVAAKYVKKGSLVAVTGSVDEETWESNGQKKSKMICLANSFNFVGGKPDGASQTTGTAKTKASAPKEQEQGNEDFVPF